MKKLILLLMLMPLVLVASAQTNPLQAKVDERVEFVTVICKISGLIDNRTSQYKPYTDEVMEYFLPYSDLVSFLMLSGRMENNIDYQTMIDFAMSSSIENGKITFKQYHSDSQSESVYYQELLSSLELIYERSSFATFFESHADLYKEAEDLYNTSVISKLQIDVLQDICGDSFSNTKIYINLLGGISYNSYIRGKNSVLLGGFITRSVNVNKKDVRLGRFFPSNDIYTLVNAISDITLAPDLNKFKLQCAKQSSYYYKSAFYLFDKAGYIDDDVFTAQISKLATLLYAEKTDKSKLPELIKQDKAFGFIWQNELWESLAEFKDNRSKYPSFVDYMPVYLNAYKSLLRY